MSELNPQFYDQLAKRLDRQDESLDRLERGQASLLACMNTHKNTLAAHESGDKSNFRWIKWVLGGAWAAIGSIITFLLKH